MYCFAFAARRLTLFSRIGDVHRGQHTEDVCLHYSGEPVKVERKDRRDSDIKYRDGRKHVSDRSGDQTEQRRAGSCKRSVDQAVDYDTREDVSEMTARHTDGC